MIDLDWVSSNVELVVPAFAICLIVLVFAYGIRNSQQPPAFIEDDKKRKVPPVNRKKPKPKSKPKDGVPNGLGSAKATAAPAQEKTVVNNKAAANAEGSRGNRAALQKMEKEQAKATGAKKELAAANKLAKQQQAQKGKMEKVDTEVKKGAKTVSAETSAPVQDQWVTIVSKKQKKDLKDNKEEDQSNQDQPVTRQQREAPLWKPTRPAAKPAPSKVMLSPTPVVQTRPRIRRQELKSTISGPVWGDQGVQELRGMLKEESNEDGKEETAEDKTDMVLEDSAENVPGEVMEVKSSVVVEIAKETPDVANEIPEVAKEIPEVAKEIPEVAKDIPEVAKEIPEPPPEDKPKQEDPFPEVKDDDLMIMDWSAAVDQVEAEQKAADTNLAFDEIGEEEILPKKMSKAAARKAKKAAGGEAKPVPSVQPASAAEPKVKDVRVVKESTHEDQSKVAEQAVAAPPVSTAQDQKSDPMNPGELQGNPVEEEQSKSQTKSEDLADQNQGAGANAAPPADSEWIEAKSFKQKKKKPARRD